MSHQRQPRLVGGDTRTLHALQIVRPGVFFGKANLETYDEVAILLRNLDGELGIAVAEVLQFTHVGRAARDHADANNVEQGPNPRGPAEMMNFRKAGKVKAPEVPASSAVVTPLLTQ